MYLCELCTESLTLAYSFWEQIKQSDVKFVKESQIKVKNQTEQTQLAMDNNDNDADDEDFVNSEHSIGSDEVSPKSAPNKRKRRKSKSKPTDTHEMNTTKIGVNIGLPHFVIAYADFDENEAHDPIDNSNDADESSAIDLESNRKRIKTLKPSAVILMNLEKINEMCLSPLEIDGDTKSIYKCSHCPKAFAAPHHLMIHMRKSHMCQYCLACFNKINDLYSHVKETHRRFDCLLCCKEFQSNGNLRQHMRKNHGIFLPAHISLLNISDVSQ